MDMFNQSSPAPYSPGAVALQNAFVNRVFGWMTAGLALTGFIAYYLSANYAMQIAKNHGLYVVLILLELVVVMGLSFAINKISAFVALLGFLFFAALNGVTLSWIFLAYDSASIAKTFFATSATFGAMGLFGYITKKDLTGIGSLCFMGLIGLIIASVLNVIWPNSRVGLVISIVGVLIFVGLVAYDTQKIKQLAWAVGEGEVDAETGKKYAIFGALTLYLDFVNLFLYLLRLLGNRK